MMDITPYMEIETAPRALFNQLAERADQPRFYVRGAEGKWEPITWGQFALQVRRVALFLADSGLRPGERAAIFANNRIEWGSAALGIQAAGGAMVPIYPANTPEQTAYVARHSDSRFLFLDSPELLARVVAKWREYEAVERIVMFREFDVQAELDRLGVTDRPSAAELDARLLSWPAVMERKRPGNGDGEAAAVDELVDAIDLDQPSMMLYTSGTSGTPKGVPLTHNNAGANGRGWLINNAPTLHENAVDLLWLPMSHIFGFGELCLGNTLAYTSYMATPLDVLDLLPEVKPTVFMSVPAYWEKLARAAMVETDPQRRREKLAEITGGRLRFCLSGGAGLKREVKELFYESGMLIIEGYGLTECSPTLTLNRPGDFRFDTVGKPIDSVELKLADDGEILARGPNVFSGYHKDPEATAGCFTEDGWFKTGDIGQFTEDGFLKIVDRKKDILVTAGGKNIPPANIELCFRDDPLIEHVVVYGDGKKYLVAGVWLAQDVPDAESAVQRSIDQVNSTLAHHETIKKFRIMNRPLTVEDGFLTASLKLRRKQVYQAFAADLDTLYEDVEQMR